MKIYLDDVREPSHTYSNSKEWTVVRTFTEFCLVVAQNDPTAISFDHDLGEHTPTGMDCAKWLVDYALDGYIDLTRVELLVHSANPPGAANIRSLLSSYVSHVRNTVREKSNE